MASNGEVPTYWSRFKPLLDRCTHAELTSVILIRGKNQYQNLFSVLTFYRGTGATNSFSKLTKVPETLASTELQFGIYSSIVSAADGCRALPASNQFVEPLKSTTVAQTGQWADPVFVGQEDHALRSVVPNLDAQFWVFQHLPTNDALGAELGERALKQVFARVRELLRISLDTRPEYAGSFLVVLPEYRGSIRVERGEQGRIGLEFRGDRGAIHPAALVRVSRNGQNCASSLVELNERFKVVEVGVADFQEVELYDLDSGILIDREAGTPLRSISMIQHVVGETVEFEVQFTDKAGQPAGKPIPVLTSWGTNHESNLGKTNDWERRQRESALLAEQKQLYNAGRLFFYEGGHPKGQPISERERAVTDIRHLIRHQALKELRIWDPFFGGSDAVEFLPYITDPTLSIRILTSLAQTDENAKNANKLEDRKRQLRHALTELAKPRGRSPGMTNIETRLGHGFHDRFLITDVRCWQLGSSFNSIGSSISTIVEFPYSALVVEAFDQAWSKATVIS